MLVKNDFHSWTQLHGTVLNAIPDILLGYVVLQRVPAAHKPNSPTDAAGARTNGDPDEGLGILRQERREL